jgi:hypothetical protein
MFLVEATRGRAVCLRQALGPVPRLSCRAGPPQRPSDVVVGGHLTRRRGNLRVASVKTCLGVPGGYAGGPPSPPSCPLRGPHAAGQTAFGSRSAQGSVSCAGPVPVSVLWTLPGAGTGHEVGATSVWSYVWDGARGPRGFLVSSRYVGLMGRSTGLPPRAGWENIGVLLTISPRDTTPASRPRPSQ